METNLVYATFLIPYLFESLSKHVDVVVAECGYASYYGFWYDVGAIVHAPYSNFENGSIDLRGKNQQLPN